MTKRDQVTGKGKVMVTQVWKTDLAFTPGLLLASQMHLDVKPNFDPLGSQAQWKPDLSVFI